MKNKKFLSLFLCLILVLSLALTACEAPSTPQNIVEDDNTVTTLIAGSDFQYLDGNEVGRERLTNFMNTLVANGVDKADGFLFCGDYDFAYGNAEQTTAAIGVIKETVKHVVSDNLVFVQGNHDAAVGTEGLSPSGANDPENGRYGVFVLHNSDYMWHNDNEAVIKRTAQRLTEYLNEKLVLSYNKPIFVISHLPMHYSMRTKLDGDKMYANYIFDVLNEAGKKGLNIFYLYGHDHTNGWDDYLGGSSVFLKKGDNILIAQASQTEFKEETLNFTYLNAGYIGYYDDHNGVDHTLTMTVFDITNKDVTVSRYSQEGLHNLKSTGVTNKYKGESEYQPDTNEYASPQKIELTTITDTTLLKNVIDEPAEGTGGKYIRVTNANKLKDGSRYLLVYNTSSGFIMIPEVITKENSNGVKRIGMAIQSTNEFGANTVYGSFTDKEWTLTKSGSGWKLGTDEGFIKFTKTTDSAITATFESDGEVFTVGGGEDAFTFTSGNIMLNYNSRGLINGYEGNPAAFFIYEFAGYTVNVTNGKANKEDAVAGDTIKITADKAPAGKVFSKWVIVAGDAVIEDVNSESTKFTMPDSEVRIVATYTDK